MARVYLSSTYEDLVEHRRRAYKALRRLGFDVIAMEDYVAVDERPTAQCLADVAATDLYVGLFAFRYGFVPDDRNDGNFSITEMEYRHAVASQKPCLIFIVPEGSAWRTDFLDSQTGEGGQGGCIKKLRAELRRDHVVDEFTSPEQLGEVLAAAAGRWLQKRGVITSTVIASPSTVLPHPRQVRSDLLLLHAQADGADAAKIVAALGGLWRVKTSAIGLYADSAAELKELDRQVTSARSVAVLLSPVAMTILAEDRRRSQRILRLARDRVADLFGVALAPILVDEAWELSTLIEPTLGLGDGISDVATGLHNMLAERLDRGEVPEIGLPVVVVAMSAGQAAELALRPPEEVIPLLELLGGEAALGVRYGRTSSQWKPFARSGETIQQVLNSAAAAASQDMDRTQGRRIRLQAYPLDPLLNDPLITWLIYEDIARAGCLVVVDELSMFHPKIREAFLRSPLCRGQQVALVTISPVDPAGSSPFARMREQLSGYMGDAIHRFGEALDPLCELNVPERRRLVRWLYGSLPRTVDAARDAQRDPDKLADFAEEVGRRASPAMARLVSGERGPT